MERDGLGSGVLSLLRELLGEKRTMREELLGSLGVGVDSRTVVRLGVDGATVLRGVSFGSSTLRNEVVVRTLVRGTVVSFGPEELRVLGAVLLRLGLLGAGVVMLRDGEGGSVRPTDGASDRLGGVLRTEDGASALLEEPPGRMLVTVRGVLGTVVRPTDGVSVLRVVGEVLSGGALRRTVAEGVVSRGVVAEGSPGSLLPESVVGRPGAMSPPRGALV